MSADEASKREITSVTSSRWFVAGGVVSVVSALVLAWKGTVCVDVLKILLARDLSELTSLGQRLGRVSWCPIGIAVGTTLIAAGFRRTALRGRLSPRCLIAVGLYGVLAACGAFFLFQGTSDARGAMFVIATSNQPVKPEEIVAVVSQTAMAVHAGWALFAVAQIVLSIGGLLLLADQPKSVSVPRPWPKSANMALSLLWVFGAVASTSWVRRSWEILQLRTNEPIKASIIAEMLEGVLSMSWFASLFLFGHAVLTTVVAVATYRTLAHSRAAGIQNH